MEIAHHCWWTRRRLTQLSEQRQHLHGAGVPVAVLKLAADKLGAAFSTRQSTSDEDGEEVAIGDLASGATHDACFFSLEPVTLELKGAVLDAVLDLHAHYLGRDVDWSRIRGTLIDQWRADVTVRIRSFPARGQVTVRRSVAGAGLVSRLFAPSTRIDCSSGVAIAR
jgi:hypothetical protein